MANEDNEIGQIIWRTAPKTYAASKRVGVTKEQEEDLGGYTYLWNQNKKLLELPDSVARVEYNKLPAETKDMLSTVYGRTIYNSDPINKSKFTQVLDGFQKYANFFTQPYRFARANPQGPQLPERDKSALDKIQDVLIGGNVTDMRRLMNSQQWRDSYQGEQLFDTEKEKVVQGSYNPGTYKVAKLLSMKKGFGEVMALAESPQELKALIDFTTLLDEDPNAAKETELAKAIRDLEQAKISPGRDIAGAIGLTKLDKVGTKKDPYDIVSGTIDAAYIIAADPLTYLLGPIPKAFIIARYGLLGTAAKTGTELTASLDDMFKSRSVTRYWNEVGARIDKYSKSTNLVERSEIASELSRLFGVKTATIFKAATPDKPVVVDLITEWSKAGIKDADSAKNYFINAGTAELIGRGAAGGRAPLMPTYNLFNKFGAEVINPGIRKLFGLSTPGAVKSWANEKEFALSFNNAATVGQLDDFTGTKRTLDRFTRQFERAFMGKSINIADATDANAVRQLSRMAVDSYHADVIAQAWRQASPGTRLRMWTGLLLTIGRKMGLESTNEGKQLLEAVKTTSRSLYSEDMSALKSISDLTLPKSAGLGLREGITNKELSSLAAQSKGALQDLAQQKKVYIAELTKLQDDLANAIKSSQSPEIIEGIEKSIIRVKSFIGQTGKKLTGISRGLGYDKVNIIRQALRESGMAPVETKRAIDILKNANDTDPKFFQETYDLVESLITNNEKYAKALQGYKFEDFIAMAFPTADEVAENLGKVSYNPSQLGKEQYALGWWQVGQKVSVPNFSDWAKASIANPFSRVAKSYNSVFIEKLTDFWSWFNLVPRLGLRSVVEELAFFGLTARTSDLKNLLLGKAISTELRYVGQGEAQLGLINRMIYRYIKSDTITDAERILINNTPDGLAKAVAKRVAKKQVLIRTLGLKPNVVERWVDDFVNSEFGMSVIDDINEGALATLNIGDNATQYAVLKAQRRYGLIAEWNPSVRQAIKELRIKADGEWNNLNYKAGLSYNIAWLTQIQLRVNRGTNLNFGEMVVKGLATKEKPEQTVQKLIKYIDELAKDGKMKEYALYETLGSKQFAERMYDFVAHPFLKRNGLVNDKLVKKVYQTKTDILSGSKLTRYKADDLTLDDLDQFDMLDAPETILGRTYIPIADGVEGTMNKIMEKGMSWMAKQISVLGREPIFFANYQRYRKELLSAENAMKKTHLANDIDEPLASKLASEYAANIALFLARERTLAFVDNPAVRTNVAFGMRNLARYYRATEDFYRRIGRVAKFEPQALVKARLAAEALDHTGFIYTDDNGEKYFVYPGDDIVYKATAFFISGLDFDALKQPAPVEFTGKISMLTPSVDPDAAIPTLSGPLSAIAINFIDKIILSKFAPEYSQEFKKTTLGKYAVGRGFFESFLPSTLVRWMNTFDADERNSQRASAFRKSLMYYVANDMAPGPDASAQEVQDFLVMLNNTARNVTVARALMGTFVPASPQLGLGADVPDWVKRDFDIASLKPEFNNILQTYGKDPNAMDKAMAKWTKLFPGKLAYMLSESQSTGIGSLKPTKETMNWLQDNAKLVKKYPSGAVFVAPNEGNFDLEAYSYLVDQGLTKSKIIEDFFREGIASDQYFYWRQVKTIHENRLAAAGTNAEKRYERLKWETWSKDFRKDKPLLREYLESLGSVDEKKKNAVTDIRSMILNGDMPNNPTGSAIAKMTRYYDDFTAQFDQIQGSTEAERAYKKVLRQQTVEKMLDLALKNPGAMNAYRTLFEPLVGE
jgi:hypothetical protein